MKPESGSEYPPMVLYIRCLQLLSGSDLSSVVSLLVISVISRQLEVAWPLWKYQSAEVTEGGVLSQDFQ